jgi:hypothetical protein
VISWELIRRAESKQDALLSKILKVIIQSAHPDKIILFGSIAILSISIHIFSMLNSENQDGIINY